MAIFDLTLSQLVEQSLPAGFSVSEQYIFRSTKKWQLLLWEGLGVTEADRFDLTKYSELCLILFANLVLYDVLNMASRSTFLVSMGTTSASETSTTSEGNVKRITTGPTEVEFHSSADELSKILKTTSSGPSGLVLSFMGEACMVAQKLGIKLPFCKALQQSALLQKAGVEDFRTYEQILTRNGIFNDGN